MQTEIRVLLKNLSSLGIEGGIDIEKKLYRAIYEIDLGTIEARTRKAQK